MTNNDFKCIHKYKSVCAWDQQKIKTTTETNKIKKENQQNPLNFLWFDCNENLNKNL